MIYPMTFMSQLQVEFNTTELSAYHSSLMRSSANWDSQKPTLAVKETWDTSIKSESRLNSSRRTRFLTTTSLVSKIFLSPPPLKKLRCLTQPTTRSNPWPIQELSSKFTTGLLPFKNNQKLSTSRLGIRLRTSSQPSSQKRIRSINLLMLKDFKCMMMLAFSLVFSEEKQLWTIFKLSRSLQRQMPLFHLHFSNCMLFLEFKFKHSRILFFSRLPTLRMLIQMQLQMMTLEYSLTSTRLWTLISAT